MAKGREDFGWVRELRARVGSECQAQWMLRSKSRREDPNSHSPAHDAVVNMCGYYKAA